jgi:hypothetical protein
LVRTCIQLLNWDREDVPTQTLVNPKQQKQKSRKKDGEPRTKKSDPTIIKFEPFLKSTKGGTHRSSTGEHGRIRAVASHSTIIRSAHSTSDTKIAGLPNFAPQVSKSVSVTPRAREQTPQAKTGMCLATTFSRVSLSGGQPTG